MVFFLSVFDIIREKYVPSSKNVDESNTAPILLSAISDKYKISRLTLN